jgi:hypothetical protein
MMRPLDHLDELESLHVAYESLCTLSASSDSDPIFVSHVMNILNIHFGRVINEFNIRQVKSSSGRSPDLNLVYD